MTEQEWLEDMADKWMRTTATPVFSPGLPPVLECGVRIVAAPLRLRSGSMLERIRTADEVEFYAVFGDREFTTRRRAREMTRSL